MELVLQNVYHGFKLVEEKKIQDLNSIARIFYHEKTGAYLLHLENEDDNKVFSISFRTPPENSTGVPHIIEHSVLCGSRKFPVKEPFVELAKGSLNTFLNAMTFPDKTMYPIASRNDKDFMNLMDVYLDAVLYPNIYKYDEILQQEGWHYELENREGEITYKGVVYNEMKGAFSSPESILFRKIQEALFPDTPYGVESGGDPDVIPELTQQEFETFHKKYYHPSNSYLYLYGNVKLLEALSFIDTEYLQHFDKIDVDSKIPYQPAFETPREKVVEYPITPGEKEEDKTYLSLNYVLPKSLDPEINLAFEILEHLLLETSAAPLKKALIEANIGKDFFGSFESGILQPVFSIVVKNSNEREKQRFIKVVFDTLQKLVSEGIDKKLIEASINVKEFALREADFHGYPKGLVYNIKALDSWLYDADPTLYLEHENILSKIKTALTTNYFEDLIQKYLLSNNFRSLVIVKPKKGLAEVKEAELKEKLANYKAQLSESELDKIIEQTNRLKDRQNTPDTSENLASIPLLSLEDIPTKAEPLPLVEKEENGVKVLLHPIFTNQIAYLNLYFDTTTVPMEQIPYISLLAGVLGKISTENYSYEELSKEMNIHTGGIRFSSQVFKEKHNDQKYYPKFSVKAKSLVEKLPDLFRIATEIINGSKYNEEKRLKEVIQEMRSRLEMMITQSGHMIAIKRVTSYFSPSGSYDELLSGLSFYKFIEDLEANFETKVKEITENLEQVAALIFNKNNLIISLTTEEKDYVKFQENFSVLEKILKSRDAMRYVYQFDLGPANEGLMTSSKVQYAAKAYNFERLGYEYSGSLQVLKTILSLDYLWNRIRVQGGAYGCFARFEWSGNMFFASYRDPNLKETLSVYDAAEAYLRGFDADEREMTKYIIGTISELDFPLTPSMKGEATTQYYIRHIKAEDIQKEREEVLRTKAEDIRRFADLMRDTMKENFICVLGNEDKIKSNEELFKNTVCIFE